MAAGPTMGEEEELAGRTIISMATANTGSASASCRSGWNVATTKVTTAITLRLNEAESTRVAAFPEPPAFRAWKAALCLDVIAASGEDRGMGDTLVYNPNPVLVKPVKSYKIPEFYKVVDGFINTEFSI